MVAYNAEWLKNHFDMERTLICGTQEPCEDAISRDMALEKMADYVASGYADSAEDFEEYSRIICQLPPVNPTKTGHWIRTGNYYTGAYGSIEYVKCSCCGEDSLEEGDFCPNCGAKMIEPQESEDKE